ncbi:MAG: hypothetical protein U0903_19945 [Planctomycetales bacterium]
MPASTKFFSLCLLSLSALLLSVQPLAAGLRAGVAKVDITNYEAGPVNDPLYVKALVITDETTTVVIATVDAVSLGEIGYIKNDYLGKVRAELQKDLKIPPAHVIINASHCHGIVCPDVAPRTVKAVEQAHKNLVPVKVKAGVGEEKRVGENRRLKLKNGKEADVRHAYSLPPDSEVAGIGPIDPEIGLLRLDTADGKPLAVLYNFACHPIQGVPSGGNTADYVAFASKVIEDNFEGALALFLQGCGGDINPVQYKDPDNPRNAEQHGNLLGLSAMRALHKIPGTETGPLKVINEKLDLPRADLTDKIEANQAEIDRLVNSLNGTSLNFKTFLPLYIKHKASGDYPGYYSHRYMHDKLIGREDMQKLDAQNRKNLDDYLANIQTMENITRVRTNLALLKMHQAQNVAAGKRTIEVEIVGIRIGDFVLLTFPGELTVQIGLNIKGKAPHELTFVAGYTNGYIYYCPTAEQLKNVGGAQEDSDCLLAPEWQAVFEKKAAEILQKL